MGAKRVKIVESIEPTRRPVCLKVGHPSREAAEMQRGRLYRKNRQAKKGRRRIEVYFCTTCMKWHLGRNWRADRQ